MTLTVSAAQASKNFGVYHAAAVREPLITTKNGRPPHCACAYEDFVRLSKRAQRAELAANHAAD
jgi:hypothetical protein